MVKIVKYTADVPASAGTSCSEGLEGCNLFAGSVHVCFEDGSGVTVCKECFAQRLNEGEWTCDSTVRLAS